MVCLYSIGPNGSGFESCLGHECVCLFCVCKIKRKKSNREEANETWDKQNINKKLKYVHTHTRVCVCVCVYIYIYLSFILTVHNNLFFTKSVANPIFLEN